MTSWASYVGAVPTAASPYGDAPVSYTVSIEVLIQGVINPQLCRTGNVSQPILIDLGLANITDYAWNASASCDYADDYWRAQPLSSSTLWRASLSVGTTGQLSRLLGAQKAISGSQAYVFNANDLPAFRAALRPRGTVTVRLMVRCCCRRRPITHLPAPPAGA